MNVFRTILLFILLITGIQLPAQQRTVIRNTHTWISMNSNIYVHPRWFMMADVHQRTNDFLGSGSFLFGRLGIGYQVTDHFSVAAGCGYLELYPQQPGAKTVTGEDRLYQQAQLVSRHGKLQLLQRVRLEQRWREQIVNDRFTGERRFSHRFRYLLSISLALFHKPQLPQLTLADEYMLQTRTTANTHLFDQNRLFFGIRQVISSSLSFDTGYMQVYQQTSQPGRYNLNHTFRLFFYCNLHPPAHPVKAPL